MADANQVKDIYINPIVLIYTFFNNRLFPISNIFGIYASGSRTLRRFFADFCQSRGPLLPTALSQKILRQK